MSYLTAKSLPRPVEDGGLVSAELSGQNRFGGSNLRESGAI